MSRERWWKKQGPLTVAAAVAAGALAPPADAITFTDVPALVQNPGALGGSAFASDNRWGVYAPNTALVFMQGGPADPGTVPDVLPSVDEVIHLQITGLDPGFSYTVQFDTDPLSDQHLNWSFNSAAEAFAGTNQVVYPTGPISVPVTLTFGSTGVLSGSTIDLYLGNAHSSSFYHYTILEDIHVTQNPPNPEHYYEANANPGPNAVGPSSLSNPEVLGSSGYAYDNKWGDQVYGAGNGGDDIQTSWRSGQDPPPGPGEGPLALEDVPHHIFDGLIPGHVYQIRAQVDAIDTTPLTLEYSTTSAAGALAGEHMQTSPFGIPINTEYLFFDDVFTASDLGRIHLLLGEASGNTNYSWIALDYFWVRDLTILDPGNHPAQTPPADPFPIPEPASLALLGLGAVGALKRRRA
jgi:hypothetical protein